MSTKEKMEIALRDAMRNSNNTAKQVLRMALAAIKLAEVEKNTKLDEAAVIAVLNKELKNLQEALADAEKANRPDLITGRKEEIAYIETLLPKSMSEEELIQEAQTVIKELNASSPADMGKVMKALLSRIEGRAWGDQISRVVKQLLQPEK